MEETTQLTTRPEDLPVVRFSDKLINPNLSDYERRSLSATNDPIVRALNPLEVTKGLAKVLVAANVRLGHKEKNDDDLINMAKDLYKVIIGRFRRCTLSDIALAIDLGSTRGLPGQKADEVNFISVASVVDWIAKYEVYKLQVVAKNKPFVEAQELAEEEARGNEANEAFKEELPNKIKEAFNEIKNAEKPKLISRLMYDIYFAYLWKAGVIRFSQKRLDKIAAEASVYLRAEYRKDKDGAKTVEDYLTETRKRIESRKLGFLTYCLDLKEMGENLKI